MCRKTFRFTKTRWLNQKKQWLRNLCTEKKPLVQMGTYFHGRTKKAIRAKARTLGLKIAGQTEAKEYLVSWMAGKLQDVFRQFRKWAA